MDLSTSLTYYKQKKIREAITKFAEDKEISARFYNGGFSKRPGVILYPNDVLEFAKKRAQSFHCSEELWWNPQQISTGMKRAELNELRKGWDLILDVDCPDWEFSKLTTHMFVKALQENGVTAITAKFSGNKGFHIAVPFEAFPTTIHYEGEKQLVKNLFPEGPRKIAEYLLHYISKNFAEINHNKKTITFLKQHEFSFEEMEKLAEKTQKTLFVNTCPDCGVERKTIEQKEKIIYQCSQCGHISHPKGNPETIRCESCSYPVEGRIVEQRCPNCGSEKKPEPRLNIESVVDVDTILIASRHLYRMPYSLHEKSELVSIPININRIMEFKKEEAKIENVNFEEEFLKREGVKAGDALRLFTEAFDFTYKPNTKTTNFKQIEIPENAINEENFPPCIKNILEGLEDGKKRALFILINFLRSVGWGKDQIEERIYSWNEKNPEPLREQYLKGQLAQIKKGKQILPPPSCSNTGYYKALQVCTPNEFCPKIRNPAQYAKKKDELGQNKKSKKKTSKKKTKDKKAKTEKEKKQNKRNKEILTVKIYKPVKNSVKICLKSMKRN